MSKMTLAQKRAIIAEHMKTPAGRASLAASMNRPLREYRDYTSVGRRGLSVDPLADGALPYYDKDVDVKGYVVGEEGQDVMTQVKGDRLFIPLFEIASLVKIPFSQIKQRRYDVQERVKAKTRSEVIKAEDSKIFNLFSKVCADTGGNASIPVSLAQLNVGHFSDAIGHIEKHGDIRCANIFMNPKHNSVIRKMNSAKEGFFVDFETSKALLATGVVGTLYGATINTSSQVPENEIFFVGEPEMVGAVVEAMPLTVMASDSVEDRAVLFSIFEQIGVGIHNPNGIVSIKIS